MTLQKLEVTLNTWNLVLFTHIAFTIKVPASNTYYNFDTMSPTCRAPSASFSFELKADIKKIKDWWICSRSNYDLVSNNCADITQAFLAKFAQVPYPQRFAPPYTFNHLSLGICLPSFLPIGITLPGRIFDHARFHLEPLYPRSLKLSIALASTMMVGALLGLAAAASFLSGIVLAVTISATVTLGSIASMRFFGSLNQLAMHTRRTAHHQPTPLSPENY